MTFFLAKQTYNNYMFCSILIIFFFINSVLFSQEYLDTVINRLSAVEKELEDIKDDKSGENTGIKPTFNNAIATHEKRIVDIEDELRSLNGAIEELNYKLDEIAESISEMKNIENTTKIGQIKNNSQYVQGIDSGNSLEALESNEKKTIIIEDPNSEDNPGMKVLGTINKNTEKNENTEVTANLQETENRAAINFSSSELEKLSKSPSEIYKYAYNMLVKENYIEAETSFKTFIGEHPKDPLASNAYYWLGETYYVQKKFQLAAISFARGYKNFPKGNKAIDQLFKLSLTFINLGKNEDACATFSKLDVEFPNAPKRISSRAKDYKKRAKC